MAGKPLHEQILALLGKTPTVDALRALHRVMGGLLESAQPHRLTSLVPQHLHRSKIERYPEVEAYLLEVADGSRSLAKLADLCKARFGREQAPSRSAIDRWIRRKKKEAGV